jgi:L-ribulose-5-phosphate 3-epimerase
MCRLSVLNRKQHPDPVMLTRRAFVKRTSLAAAVLAASPSAGLPTARRTELFKISLAQWTIVQALRDGVVDHLDFPKVARQNGIEAVEYVNQFFMDRAKDRTYLREMKRRADGEGVKSVLIMCDNEGRVGDPDAGRRRQAVENHFKWVDAARFLGCHAIRVNAESEGSWDEQMKLAADGLRQLCEYGARRRISVLVENHGGLSSNGKWLAGVMKLTAHPRAGTLPDFGNFRINQNETYDSYLGVEELMPFAKGVSVKPQGFDASGNRIELDYVRMMRIVVDAGYDGYCGIEYGGLDGIAAAREHLERAREELSRQS